MKFYLEITLLPNAEINNYFLWSKVFQQIHLGLVEMQNDHGCVPIGISFPEYAVGEKHCRLGNKLRLFALQETILAEFDAPKWLARLCDYVHCTGIRPVPEKLQAYAIYQRQQSKVNKERLARRYAIRHSMSYETALLRYDKMVPEFLAMPFIRLKSLSSNKAFCLWIKKTVVSEPLGTKYSTYGLSAVSTVPEF